MKNISQIKLRLIQFIKDKGLTKNKFYVKSGVANGTLDKSSKLSIDSIEKTIYTFPDLDLHWLITGKKKTKNYKIDNEVNSIKEKEENYSIDFKKEYDLLLKENREIQNEYRQLNKELRATEEKLLSFQRDNKTISNKEELKLK